MDIYNEESGCSQSEILEVESSELEQVFESVFEGVSDPEGKQDIQDISNSVQQLREIKMDIFEEISEAVRQLRTAKEDIQGIFGELHQIRELIEDINKMAKELNELKQVKQDTNRITKELTKLREDLHYVMTQTRHWRGERPV